MVHYRNSPRSLTELVEAYVRSRNRSLVSTSEGVRRVRYLVPGCKQTDREIVDLIAAAAVQHGKDIAFDSMTAG